MAVLTQLIAALILVVSRPEVKRSTPPGTPGIWLHTHDQAEGKPGEIKRGIFYLILDIYSLSLRLCKPQRFLLLRSQDER